MHHIILLSFLSDYDDMIQRRALDSHWRSLSTWEDLGTGAQFPKLSYMHVYLHGRANFYIHCVY